MRHLLYFSVCLSVLVLAACSNQLDLSASMKLERAPQAVTERQIAQGKLVGTFGADNARAWYGLPYAQPPVGELRWRAPRPPLPWEGRLEATFPDRRCTQYSFDFESPGGKPFLIGDEDCLYLNIWAPAKVSDKPLPVMFYIHGGGNSNGHAGRWEMGRLANAANVVVVNVNYRLAMLGWFAHPAIVNSADSELDRAMNFGLLDQLAALQWVQKNISVFGGNANNVTVFGESAGGFNITALLSSPLSKGLFHKAIVQSGGVKSAEYDEAVNGSKNALVGHGVSSNDFIRMLSEAGVVENADNLAGRELARALRALPADKIFQIYKTVPAPDAAPSGHIEPISTSSDGIVIPEKGVAAALFNDEPVHDIPLLIGTTRDELTGLGLGDKELSSSILGIIFRPKDKEAYLAHAWYPNTAWAYHGVEQIAQQWDATRSSPVYTYRFDWDEQGRTLGTDISTMVGAHHALDVPFLIDGFDHKTADPFGTNFKKHNRESREELSAKIIDYWAAFAYYGMPGRGLSRSLQEWTPWSADTPGSNRMLLDSESDGGTRMAVSAPTPQELYSTFLADNRFKSLRARCKSVKLLLDMHVSVGGGGADIWEGYFKDYCMDGVLD